MKIIKIKDYYGNYQEVPVSDELYEEWHSMQNETQRIYRKEIYHRSSVPFDCIDEYAFSEDECVISLLEKEAKERIYAAINSLSPIQRRKLLIYMETHNYEEVARREKCAPSSAKITIGRALMRLRFLLEE